MQKSLSRILVAASLILPIASLSVKSAEAQDLVFTLKNNSSSALTEFYVEASSENNWGDNILNEVIEPGESGRVTIGDGLTTCTYDILGVFEDGSQLDDRNLNLCELGSYTYRDK